MLYSWFDLLTIVSVPVRFKLLFYDNANFCNFQPTFLTPVEKLNDDVTHRLYQESYFLIYILKIKPILTKELI